VASHCSTSSEVPGEVRVTVCECVTVLNSVVVRPWGEAAGVGIGLFEEEIC
jgi:hypothetical protein